MSKKKGRSRKKPRNPRRELNSPSETQEKHEVGISALPIPVQPPPMDPDLQQMLDAWPTLPVALRACILAMIDAAAK